LGRFREGLIDFVCHADAPQLMAQVGNHATGNLMNILGVVILGRFADGQIVLPGAGGEVLRYLPQRFFVQQGSVAQGAGVHCDVENGRVR
jgi:hypothetical protein